LTEYSDSLSYISHDAHNAVTDTVDDECGKKYDISVTQNAGRVLEKNWKELFTSLAL
jgi:hypothetical protein